MEFLTAGELTQNKAGYLTTTKGQPVGHSEWVKAQNEAHYYVELAKAVAGKSFKVEKVEDLNFLKQIVRDSINATKVEVHKEVPSEPSRPVNESLLKEATTWHTYQQEKKASLKLNTVMQQFNIIKQVEEVGDFFSNEVVKVQAIYKLSDVLAAVEVVLAAE